MIEQRTNLQKYYSPKELAEMLNISVLTIYGWTSKRKIPFTKIGRLVKFERGKIDNWLRQKAVPCVADLS